MNAGIIKKLKIISINKNTALASTIMLEPVDWQPDYQSGQFITFVFNTKNGEKRRSYSITSSPVLNEPLTITVKKIDNGEFSRWLVFKAKVGDVLHTTGISGFFVLPHDIPGKIFCFLAAGSGITPCYSLIKTLLKTTKDKIHLIYSNRNENQTIFYDELKNLQYEYEDRFLIHFLFSNRHDVYRSRLSHWMLTHFMDTYFDRAARGNILFYVCGPFDYMMMVTISLRNNGIQNSQIFKEDFDPRPPAVLPVPPDKSEHNVTIHVENMVYQLKVQYPQTITAAAKAAHITLPYSCEAGRCGSCVATCIKGKVWMAYNEVLMDEEIAKGRVLTCQGFPVGGDAELRFGKE